MRLPCVFALALLAACPPAPTPDGGLVDSGQDDAGDAGTDGGRPRPDAGQPDAGFTRVAAEDWCASQALAVCSRDIRCLRILPSELAACLARRAEGCDQLAYTRAVREGRLQFLETAALACLNKNGQGSCAEAPADCADVFLGLVPPDGGCVLEIECDPTAGFCYPYDGQCPHRCRAFRPLGSPCDSFTTRCGPEAACEQGDGGVNVCQPVKDAGEACVAYEGCAESMVCTSSVCTRRTAGAGETCGETNGYPFCRSEYFCRQNQTVTPLPPGTCQLRAGLGGACSGNTDCLPNLRCSTVLTTGVCLEKAGPDAGCASYDDCRDGLFCSARSERCEPLPTAGGDCGNTGSFYRCATGFFCEYGPAGDDRCLARRALGGPCLYDGQCLSNDCEYGTLPDGGFGGRCIEPCSVRADGGL